MTGKRRKKHQVKPKPRVPARHAGEEKPAPDREADDPTFDFGGLPDRDLKKNLGCG